MGVSLIGGAAGIVVPVNTSPTKPPLSLFSGGNRQGNVSPPKAGLNGSTGFSRDMSPGKLFAYFFNSGNSHKEIHSLEITPSNSDNYSLPSSLSGSDSLDENYNSKSHSPISPLSASPSSDGSAHKESTTLYNSGTSIINQVRNKEISHEEKSALVHAIDLIKTTPDIKKLLVSIIEIKGVDCFNLVRSRLYLRNYLIILVYFKHQLQTKGKFTNFEFDKDEFNKFKGWLEDNYTGDMASLNLQQNDCEKIKVVNGVVKHTLHENDYNMQVKIDKLNLNRNEIKVRAMRNFEYNIVGNLWDDILKVYAYCEHMVYDFFMQTRGVNKNLLPSRRLDSRLALNKRWDIANKDELMRCFNASYGDVPLKNGTFWQIGKTQYAGYNKPADLEKLFSPIFEAVKIMEDVDSLNLFIHMFTSGVRNPHVMGVKVYKYTNLVDTTLNYFKCYFIDPHSKNDEVGHTVNLYPERFKDREYIRNVSHHIVQRLHSLRQAVARKDAIFLRFICLYPKELRTITSKINLLPETFESALTVLGGEGHIFKYKEDFILAWLMYDDSNIGNILGKKIIVQQLMEKMIKSEVLSSCMTTAKAKNNLVAAMQEWIEGSVGGLTVQTESAIKQWVTADINENDLLIDKNTNIKEQIELIKRVVREVDKIIKVEVWGGACFYGEHAWKLMKDIFGTSGIMARCDDIVSNGNFKSGSLLCGAFTPLERAIINKAYAFIKFFINHVARNSDKLEVLNKIKELVVARLDGWGESDLKPFVEHGIVPSTFYSDCMRDQTGSLKTTMLKHWHLFRAKF